MDNRDFDNYSHILRERQAELERQLKLAAMLHDPTQIHGMRPRMAFTLAATSFLVLLIVLASIRLPA